MEKIKNSFLLFKLNQYIIKLLSSISIFTLTVFFTPNFEIISFPILILSSIIIILFENLINTVIGTDNITLGKGIIGFTVASIVIYTTQFFIDGYYISVLSTIIAATIYGIIVAMINENI